jgi:asparagine synthase (glutamine-hydrolysing)
MCGISGIIGADPRDVEPAVRRMMRAMVHRGPDDEGYVELPLGSHDEATVAGFGFRRLAILDLSPAGHQPMVNPATGDCLVFNGEIYNFRTLRARLQAQGVSFTSSGDSEVLLQSLSTWGERALDMLDGMFAFAFYEARNRRILLARDPFGVKPLYVAHVRGGLAFASEVRSLLASGMVPDDLDPAGMASYLAYGATQDPLTMHRAIRALGAGSAAWVSWPVLAPVVRRYWTFPWPQPVPDEPVLLQTLRTKLSDTVGDQCLADVPTGVFLSGGIDSAAVAALASRHVQDLRTLSIGFEASRGADELADAAATARFLGTKHYQTVLDDDWIQQQWREWLWAMDRPSIDGLNTFIISGVATDLGLKVALSGLGADEIYGGYPTFRQGPKLARMLGVLALVPPALRCAVARCALAWAPRGRRDKVEDLVGGGTSVPEVVASLRRTVCTRDVARLGFPVGVPGLTGQYLPTEAIEADVSRRSDPFNEVSRAECRLYMGNTLLRDADTNGMAHSLEIRVPFLGRDVADFVTGLPGLAKVPRRAPAKHLLRQAVAGILPADLFTRHKRGFTLPVGQWMQGPLRDQCEAAVETLAACPLVDARGTRELWAQYTENPAAVQPSRPMTLVALGSYLARRAEVRAQAG